MDNAVRIVSLSATLNAQVDDMLAQAIRDNSIKGLSPNNAAILLLVPDTKPNVKAIALATGLTNISYNVARLCNAGFLKVTRQPLDKRSLDVEITAQGFEARHLLRQSLERQIGERTVDFAKMYAILDRILYSAEQNRRESAA